MLQPAASRPEVPLCPAPWDLHGRGRIVALEPPAQHAAHDAFLPHELAGRGRLSISRILVSTWDSVVNGRNNRGIAKDRADFEVRQEGIGEIIRVTSEGRQVCDLRFATVRFAPPLPVHGGILPAALRTLAQRFRGYSCYYVPAARGRVRPGRLLSSRRSASTRSD